MLARKPYKQCKQEKGLNKRNLEKQQGYNHMIHQHKPYYFFV